MNYRYENTDRKYYTADTKGRKPSRFKQENKAPDKFNKKRNKSSKSNKLIYILCSGVLLVSLIFTLGMVFWSSNFDFTYNKKITVSGISIGGLTKKEAKEKLELYGEKTITNFKINVNSREESDTFVPDDFSFDFYIDEALAQAEAYTQYKKGNLSKSEEAQWENVEPNFTLEYKVKPESVSKVASDFAKKVNQKAVNARVEEFKPFAKNRFIYKEAQEGYELIESELISRITEAIESKNSVTDIEATVNVVKPEITVKDLKKNIVGLSTATSVSYNTANGTHNMATALKACNGSIIEGGEIWSFNDCTGNSNLEENGYKTATVISNKALAQGVGGGLCQASTTIFKAAIFANMGIYERHNHYWASAYAYAGEDATIDYPNLDLKLKNVTDYQMFIECKVEGNTLIVNIYGYQDPSYDNIKIHSKNYEIKKGVSYKTITYRTLYLENKVVKEDVLCYSTYSLKDGNSVRPADSGTFRTLVDGTQQIETEPPTEATTKATEKPTKKPTEKATEKKTKPSTEKPTKKPTEVITEATTQPTATENVTEPATEATEVVTEQ